VARLGYRPSNIARGLVTKRTGTLGLVVPDNANPFFSEVARGAEHVAYAQGYNVFLCNTEEDTQRELAVLQLLEEKQVDGVVLCSSRLSDDVLQNVVTRHPAVILVNRRLTGGSVGAVLVDDEFGACLSIRHLLQTGHITIGFLAGPMASHSSSERSKGYRAALAEAGLDYLPRRVRHCAPTVEGGREAACELLSAQSDLTALYCYNDLVAVGALQACAALGRTVPDDIAIVGVDNTLLASLVTPPLSTCGISRDELGAQAMQLLLKCINGEEHCQEVILKPAFVVRASAP
jgi:LacI family transcriptional regulator